MKIKKATKKDLKKIAEIFRIEYSKPPYNGKWNKKNYKYFFKKTFLGMK